MTETVRMPLRVAFVLEQTLGHVTHSKNLAEVVRRSRDIEPTWLPVPFAADGASRYVPLLRSNWSVRAGWRARRAVAPVADEHDALVFHTQVPAVFSADLMRRVPTVVSLDATPVNYDSLASAYNHRPAGDGLLDRLKFRLNRAVFEAAATLVTWSEWAKASLIQDYGIDARKIRVLAPGAAPAYFDIGGARAETEPNPTEAREPVRILFVGGDFARKGGPLLLDCLHGELSEACELHVVTQQKVVGGPSVHVHTGVGPNSPKLLQLFRTADIFVLPSSGECLAVVLMEATAASLPVVTTHVGALGEAVLHGTSGFIVDPGDGQHLRQALVSLVQDPALRRRMGRAGHELAVRKFDANRNNEELIETVREVARLGPPQAERRAAGKRLAPPANNDGSVQRVDYSPQGPRV